MASHCEQPAAVADHQRVSALSVSYLQISAAPERAIPADHSEIVAASAEPANDRAVGEHRAAVLDQQAVVAVADAGHADVQTGKIAPDRARADYPHQVIDADVAD